MPTCDSFYSLSGELYLIYGMMLIELGFFLHGGVGWWGLGESPKNLYNWRGRIINVNDSIFQLKLWHIKQGKHACGS